MPMWVVTRMPCFRRSPMRLRNYAVAYKAGMDDTPNDAMLNAVRDRLAAFAQTPAGRERTPTTARPLTQDLRTLLSRRRAER